MSRSQIWDGTQWIDMTSAAPASDDTYLRLDGGNQMSGPVQFDDFGWTDDLLIRSPGGTTGFYFVSDVLTGVVAGGNDVAWFGTAANPQIRVNDGSAGSPGYAFIGSPSQGMWRSGNIVTVKGTDQVTFAAPIANVEGVWKSHIGSAVLPSYGFTSYPEMGMYAGGVEQLNWSMRNNRIRMMLTPDFLVVGHGGTWTAKIKGVGSTTAPTYTFSDREYVGFGYSVSSLPQIFANSNTGDLYEFRTDRFLPHPDNTAYLGDSVRRWIRLYASQTSVIGSRAADKDNLRDVPDSGELIDALVPQFWERDGEPSAGFTVEQWEDFGPFDGWTPIDPEAVGLSYEELIAPMWRELRSLRVRVAALEAASS